MARYEGTVNDFIKYVGPKLTNLVQAKSKAYKKKIGQCEQCGEKAKELEAAHVHGPGTDRPALIRKALDGYIKDNMVELVEVSVIEQRFIDLHQPFSKTIMVLCKDCHVKYDDKKRGTSKTEKHLTINPSTSKLNDNEGLKRKLNSIGKAFFVKNYTSFKAYYDGKLSKDKCIELLMSKNVSKNKAGASIVCGNAKLIFESKKECNALKIVLESTRLPSDVVDMANKLLTENCSRKEKT